MSLTALLASSILLIADYPLPPDEPDPQVGVYTPIRGGWQIRITGDVAAPRPAPGSAIGVVEGDCRVHRRPLYPPADRSLLWTPEQLAQIPRSSFRPLVVAYNEPRFLFDYHAAGGAMGHLFIGVTRGEASKWLHQWSEIDVRYVDGRMEYVLRDPAFEGLTVNLSAAPLAHSVGLIVKVDVVGKAPEEPTVTWAYGGASGYFSNYDMTALQWTYAPEQCAKDRIRASGSNFELRRAFDKSDVITNEIFSAWRKLPQWEARMQGGSAGTARVGTSDPQRMNDNSGRIEQSCALEQHGRRRSRRASPSASWVRRTSLS